jgi:hypothetical protein
MRLDDAAWCGAGKASSTVSPTLAEGRITHETSHKMNRSMKQDQYRKIVLAIQNYLTTVTSITLAGTAYTPAQIVSFYQNLIALGDAVAAAKAVYESAVKANDDGQVQSQTRAKRVQEFHPEHVRRSGRPSRRLHVLAPQGRERGCVDEGRGGVEEGGHAPSSTHPGQEPEEGGDGDGDAPRRLRLGPARLRRRWSTEAARRRPCSPHQQRTARLRLRRSVVDSRKREIRASTGLPLFLVPLTPRRRGGSPAPPSRPACSRCSRGARA